LAQGLQSSAEDWVCYPQSGDTGPHGLQANRYIRNRAKKYLK